MSLSDGKVFDSLFNLQCAECKVLLTGFLMGYNFEGKTLCWACKLIHTLNKKEKHDEQRTNGAS